MSYPRFDLADPAFLENPATQLAAMRAAGPLVPVKFPLVGKIWVTTTHAATAEIAKGKDRFVLDGRAAGLSRGPAGFQWWMPRSIWLMTNNMLAKDDPEHRRLRKSVDQAFARRDVRDMRAGIATLAQQMAQDLGPGVTNLVPNFSQRLPLAVIADLLGVPTQDQQNFLATGAGFGDLTGIGALFRITGALRRLIRVTQDMVQRARVAPQPGLIAELLDPDEDSDRLSDDELIAMVILLLFAGFETTTNLISGAVVALERNPEQKAWLLADFDARIETATEELCRYVSAVGGTKPRFVLQDTRVQGVDLPRKAKVMALPIAANYDPAVFDQPERLQLDRFPNPHLSFSTGNHFCLGMQLARVELQEALRALYTRWPDLRLGDAAPTYAKRPGHRAITRIDIASV